MTAVAESDIVAERENREEEERPDNADLELCALDRPVALRQNTTASSMRASDALVRQHTQLPHRNTPSESTIVVPDGREPSTTRSHSLRISVHLLLNAHDTYVEYGRSYVDHNCLEPNDEKQNNQLDMTHHLYSLILDGQLYLAPIAQNPRNVLDVGTGTGIWAMEFAEKHPLAQVTGCDLSPVYKARLIPNVSFDVKDVRKPWGYEPSRFDFIHARDMNISVSESPGFYEQVFL